MVYLTASNICFQHSTTDPCGKLFIIIIIRYLLNMSKVSLKLHSVGLVEQQQSRILSEPHWMLLFRCMVQILRTIIDASCCMFARYSARRLSVAKMKISRTCGPVVFRPPFVIVSSLVTWLMEQLNRSSRRRWLDATAEHWYDCRGLRLCRITVFEPSSNITASLSNTRRYCVYTVRHSDWQFDPCYCVPDAW